MRRGARGRMHRRDRGGKRLRLDREAVPVVGHKAGHEAEREPERARSRDGAIRMEKGRARNAEEPRAARADRRGRSRGDGDNPDRGRRVLGRRGRARVGRERRDRGIRGQERQGHEMRDPGRRVTGRAGLRDRSRAMHDRHGRRGMKRPGMSRVRVGRVSTNHEEMDRGGMRVVGRDRVAKDRRPGGHAGAGKGRMAGSRMAGTGDRRVRAGGLAIANAPVGAIGHLVLHRGTGRAEPNVRSAASRSPKVARAGDRGSLRAGRGLRATHRLNENRAESSRVVPVAGRARVPGHVPVAMLRGTRDRAGQGRWRKERGQQGEDRGRRRTAARRRPWTGCCREPA